jgi:hypothetical protein
VRNKREGSEQEASIERVNIALDQNEQGMAHMLSARQSRFNIDDQDGVLAQGYIKRETVLVLFHLDLLWEADE